MRASSSLTLAFALVATPACSGGAQTTPPVQSTGDDAGSSDDATTPEAGATFGPDGGTLDDLSFVVVGDTRPPSIDDTAGYPTAIIGKIYSDIAARNPLPPFAISTGDYQFSSTGTLESSTQMDLYLAARSKFSGPLFPVMGNHECTGSTSSNCGPGNPDGETANYRAFLSKMLSPIGKQSAPYYEMKVAAADGSWTAKFLFTAANAWTSDQATWLDQAMGETTTYTFVVRHEASWVSQAPGVAPSEAIMAKHPYTLAIVGHSHTFDRSGPREVTIGNGGAPISGSVNYGYGLVQRRSDGAIQVENIDYQTGNASLRFAVKADGSPTN